MTPPSNYYAALNQAASAYGTPAGVLDAVAVRESGRNQSAKNDWDSNAAAGHPSTGIIQFIPSTYKAYAASAKKANPEAWRGVKDGTAKAQLLAGSWAMANGKGSAWSTYSKALANPTKGLPETTRTAATATSGSPTTAVSNEGGSRWNPAQSAALAMVFAKNDSMLRIIGATKATDAAQATVLKSTPAVKAQVAAAGDDGGVVATALGEVGKTAADAMKYIKAAGGTGHEAWCGDFVQWVFKQRGLAVPPARSVPSLLAWGQKNKRVVKNPVAGDLVAIDFDRDGTPDHVEIVRGRLKGGGVSTVGGNTSTPGGGKGVATKNRTPDVGTLTYIRALAA